LLSRHQVSESFRKPLDSQQTQNADFRLFHESCEVKPLGNLVRWSPFGE
jgi:hypothetical protein